MNIHEEPASDIFGGKPAKVYLIESISFHVKKDNGQGPVVDRNWSPFGV